MSVAKFSERLEQVGGVVFGRNINAYARQVNVDHIALSITIRNKPAAVVLSPSDYDQLVSIREKYEAIIRDQQAQALEAARNEFDDLYALMASKKSASVIRGMVNVTGDELAETYQPGRTETK